MPAFLAWQNRPAWCVLDTAFDDGHHFLSTWQKWLCDSQHSRMLHYVAVCGQAPNRASVQRALQAFPALQPHADTLTRQWFGLLPGFHRIVLGDGQVLLTLCVGDLKAMLREQRFTADTVLLGPSDTTHWALKAVARCCRRGTVLVTHGLNDTTREPLHDVLAALGFELQVQAGQMHGHFNPRWDLSNSRGGRPDLSAVAATPTSCVVIGAGLAGASVAAALARRGWRVQVLDAAPTPAAGASGLPAGLAVPHTSPDNSPRSRLSRAGLRLTLEQARFMLVSGHDYEACGTLERRLDGKLGLPADWPQAGNDWSADATDPATGAALWHPHAAWIKPAQLIAAWLKQPGVNWVPNTKVNRLTPTPEGWVISGAAGQLLATAPLVVVAAAGQSLVLLKSTRDDGSASLSPTLKPGFGRVDSLHELAGQVSWGLHQPGDAAVFPDVPVNGSGSFIPAVPTPVGPAWFAGATYEALGAAGRHPLSQTTQHSDNLNKLEALLPSTAARLKPRYQHHSVQAWSGVRCATSDRLPVVDAMAVGESPGLWVSAALGSRGLSLCVLCAELLAARLHAEPLPVEKRLARLLSA